MHRFNKYIALRRDYFFTYILFQDKSEKSFQQRIRMFYLLNKRFGEALDLLPERERGLLLQHINNPNIESPFYLPLFRDEKNQNYARLLVNRSITTVEDYLRRFDFYVPIPRIPLKDICTEATEEEDGCIITEDICHEDPLLAYQGKAKILGVSPQLLYDVDHLTKHEPEAKSLSEKELYLRVKQKCAENDLPDELSFYLLTTVAEYLREGTSTPILLVGKPGIGKTYFGKVFAEIIGLHYYKISAPGASAGRGLTGDSPTYKAARFGEIISAQLEAKATNPVILIDEIDKCPANASHHSLSDELLSCLDGTRTIKDHFFETEISTSAIPFILTANVLRNVPAWLRDRCLTIEFPDPSAERIASITQKKFDSLKKNALYHDRIKMDHEAFLRTVLAMRGRDIVSLRQYSSIIENAAKAAYLEMLENNKKSMTITDRHFNQVMKLLGSPATDRRIGFRTE